MESKQIGNYTFMSNGNDWFWDNDENGMTYLIWDRSHNIHDNDNSGFKAYQLVMTPQSNVGPSITIELQKNSMPISVTEDPKQASCWMNDLCNKDFPDECVPEYICQYESVRRFNNALSSRRMTETDIDNLEYNVLSSYHVNESDVLSYLDVKNGTGHFTESNVEVYNNCKKFVEANTFTAPSAIANAGIGAGAGALGSFVGNALGGHNLIGGAIGTAAGGVGAFLNAKNAFKNRWASEAQVEQSENGFIYTDPDSKKKYVVEVGDKNKVTGLKELDDANESNSNSTSAAPKTEDNKEQSANTKTTDTKTVESK